MVYQNEADHTLSDIFPVSDGLGSRSSSDLNRGFTNGKYKLIPFLDAISFSSSVTLFSKNPVIGSGFSPPLFLLISKTLIALNQISNT